MATTLSELLVFGYIHTKCYVNVPVPIITLCLLYYDYILYWITHLKNPSNITMNKLKNLFAVNTNKLNNRYQVYQHFHNLSLALIRDLVLVFPQKNKEQKHKLYQFVELEFYCLDHNHHKDVFPHCTDLELTTSANWNFHRSGNCGVAAYKFMSNWNNNKKWINPRPHANFRNGTFKGLDITFGEINKVFGGILIRSMRELIPSNHTIYIPSDIIIDGPCKCVDNILKECNLINIKTLTESKRFTLDIFDNDNDDNIMYIDLAKNYNIQQQVVSNDRKYEIFYNDYFYNSPRIGLTLKREKCLSGKELEEFQRIKEDYLMAPYRSIRTDCLRKMRRYKVLIVLSMVYNQYWYNKLYNKQHDNMQNYREGFKNTLSLTSLKEVALKQIIKQCQNGQNNKGKVIKDAKLKFSPKNEALAKLFGALM